MRFKKLISAFLAAAFCVSLAGMAFAEKLTKVPTAWMDEHETFLIWYAKEKGWDKEAGLDIDIQYFGSGMDILNALPSGSWVFAGMGGVPAMMGNLRYGTSVIAIGNDESMTNSVLVRPDSPIAKVKGYNKDFPEVLGSPDTVKGKTFLTTTVSSAHYGLSSWLKVLGLTDKDITIKNMDQAQALAAFDNGIGDGVALWAPHMYAGQEKGWKIAGDLHMCKVGNPIVLIADTAYAERTLKSPRNSSASTCAPSTCCRRNPWNPSFPNTSASSWNGPVRTIPPNCPSPTSRRTPSTTWKNSSPCLILPRA